MRFYKPYVQIKDDALPPLTEGRSVMVKRVTLTEHFTKPPPRFNPRTLLEKMEKEEIGTKATRAATIQTLQDRKYLHGADNLSVSDLGFSVIEVLAAYCPEVVSSEMTRTLETQMEQIQQGKATKAAVLQNAIDALKPVLAKLKMQETAVGAQLGVSLSAARLEARTVGVCPNCKTGRLVVLHSKKTGKRFVGCTNYFEATKCQTTYPLPQVGVIKPLGKSCGSCGAPIISVYSPGRRAWRLCVNPKCPSKGEAKP
jgi:DNA topoisomerase-1